MSKILIIEDEVSIAELEKDYLELSGFEVDHRATREDGPETGAERAFRSDHPGSDASGDRRL